MRRRPRRLGPMLLALLAVLGGLWILREPLLRAGGRLVFPYPYRDAVEEAAAAAGVDPLLVVTVMREESGFSPDARSRAGAVGLMQLMPETARWIASRHKLRLGDLHDPRTNIGLGAAYLGYLRQQFGDDLPRVLAAYNGGEGNVSRWKDLSEAFPETRHYVRRGVATYAAYRWLYGSGRAADPILAAPATSSAAARGGGSASD